MNKFYIKNLIAKTIIISLLLFLKIPVFAFSDIGVEVNAIDTIAGYGTLVKAKGPNSDFIEIKIEKPDKNTLIIPVETNEEGNAEFDLYPYHTKKAGLYKIAGKTKTSDLYGPIETFKVYADEVSETRSNVSLNMLTVPANGTNYAIVTVKLVDDYGNPIFGHNVSIITSRNEDEIENIGSRETDQDGIIEFKISSNKEGVSVIRVQDLTANKILENISKIAFLEPIKSKEYIGGEYEDIKLTAQATNNKSSQIVSSFKIEDIPEEVSIEKPITFKVKALDEEKETVTGYKGTVHFFSTDNNATIPQDYTFIEEDVGEHTFSIGLKFITEGTQTFSVVDADNEDIKGEVTIKIISNEFKGTAGKPSAEVATINITSPKTGKTRSQKFDIEGTASSNSEIHIYDSGKEILKTNSDSNGKFKKETNTLTDGKHIITAAILDKNGKKISESNSIEVTIDIAPPTIDSVETNPESPIAPSKNFEIKLYSDEKLAKGTAILKDETYQLTNSKEDTGLYTAKINAPKEEGTYDIDFVLLDELGNSATYPQKLEIEISAQNNDNIETEKKAANKDEDILPSKVTGIEYDPESEKITFTWEASIDDTGINNYRFYYGEKKNEINTIVNTFDSSTEWYVPNLKPNTLYYFQMTAIDVDFNESAEKSDIMEIKTLSSGETAPIDKKDKNIDKNSEGMGGGSSTFEFDEEDEKAKIEFQKPKDNPKTGSGIFIIILMTIIGTNFYLQTKKLLRKKDCK